MDNRDTNAWEANRKALEKLGANSIGCQNAKGTQFSMHAAKKEKPPPSIDPKEAV